MKIQLPQPTKKIQKSAKIISLILFHFNRMNTCTLDSIKKIKMEIKNRFSNKGLIKEILISLDELIHQQNPACQINDFKNRIDHIVRSIRHYELIFFSNIFIASRRTR